MSTESMLCVDQPAVALETKWSLLQCNICLLSVDFLYYFCKVHMWSSNISLVAFPTYKEPLCPKILKGKRGMVWESRVTDCSAWTASQQSPAGSKCLPFYSDGGRWEIGTFKAAETVGMVLCLKAVLTQRSTDISFESMLDVWPLTYNVSCGILYTQVSGFPNQVNSDWIYHRWTTFNLG